MERVYTAYYQSSIGLMEVKGTQDGIISILYTEKAETTPSAALPFCVRQCIGELEQYFAGERTEFSVEVILQGTEFQKRVWGALRSIPFGHTLSYRKVAELAGNGNAARAVGNANGKNRLNIVIPCHRVVGAGGELTGYGGGLWRKKWLLEHEKSVLKKFF